MCSVSKKKTLVQHKNHLAQFLTHIWNTEETFTSTLIHRNVACIIIVPKALELYKTYKNRTGFQQIPSHQDRVSYI